MIEFSLLVLIVSGLVCAGVNALPLVPSAKYCFLGAVCLVAAASIAWRAGWIGRGVSLAPAAATCPVRAV